MPQFTAGVKPYLLTEIDNNLGATTRIQYCSSTKFYLEDEQQGTPWATKLPFPVQVVAKVETLDHISKSKFVTGYKYHNGYYDHTERDFDTPNAKAPYRITASKQIIGDRKSVV